MKTLRFLGTALIATLMCVACSNEEIVPEEQDAKYVTVDLGVTGEYLKVSESPLGTRSTITNEDWINIRVYTADGSAYAWGDFHSMNNVKIKLLQGENYKFVVSIIPNCCSCTNEQMCAIGAGTTFNYSSQFNSNVPTGGRKGDTFYGELDNYTPVENDIVEIATKRVVYGAHYIAEGLTDGRLDIEVSSSMRECLYTIELTPLKSEDDNIYTFYNMRNAYDGFHYPIWDEETQTNIPGWTEYYVTKQLNITWTKDDGSVTPLGTFDVTFKRNIKTTIVIKVEDPSQQNGIVVTKEETRMTDDENKYVIEGGTITEVPVTSQQ